MTNLLELPSTYSSFPQRGRNFLGFLYDPLFSCAIDAATAPEVRLEVNELLRHRSPGRRYIGVSLEAGKVKDLNEYIGWINQFYYDNKNTYIYLSVDCDRLFLEFLNIFKWLHLKKQVVDFFIEPNNYYPLPFAERWIADINLLSASELILSTPHNLKAQLAKELTNVPVYDKIPKDVYITNLEGQPVL